MAKGLIIFDETGKIRNQSFGDIDVPKGIYCMEVDIPEGSHAIYVDMSDPEHPRIVLKESVLVDVEKLHANVARLNTENKNLKAALNTANDDLIVAQLAIAEMYEANLSITETTEQEVVE